MQKVMNRPDVHTRCPQCRYGYCSQYSTLAVALRPASSDVAAEVIPRDVTPPAPTVKQPPAPRRAGMFEHRETIAEYSLENAWLTTEDDGRWLNVRARTEGGMQKVYRFPEADARWLMACMVPIMAPLMKELE